MVLATIDRVCVRTIDACALLAMHITQHHVARRATAVQGRAGAAACAKHELWGSLLVRPRHLQRVVATHFGEGAPHKVARCLRDQFVHEVRSHCSCDFVLVGLRADLRSTRPASELVTREAALEAAEEFSNQRRLQNKSIFLNKRSTKR